MRLGAGTDMQGLTLPGQVIELRDILNEMDLIWRMGLAERA